MSVADVRHVVVGIEIGATRCVEDPGALAAHEVERTLVGELGRPQES
jgi:hypothetical protein